MPVLGDQKFWNPSVVHSATRLFLAVHHQDSWVVGCLLTFKCKILWHLLEDREKISQCNWKLQEFMYSWKQMRIMHNSHQFSPFYHLSPPQALDLHLPSVFRKYSFSLYFYFSAGNNWCISLSLCLSHPLPPSTPPNIPVCSSNKSSKKGKSKS